jgi:hypothetical protein
MYDINTYIIHGTDTYVSLSISSSSSSSSSSFFLSFFCSFFRLLLHFLLLLLLFRSTVDSFPTDPPWDCSTSSGTTSSLAPNQIKASVACAETLNYTAKVFFSPFPPFQTLPFLSLLASFLRYGVLFLPTPSPSPTRRGYGRGTFACC